MTPAEHYVIAERMLRRANRFDDLRHSTNDLLAAQAHAALAAVPNAHTAKAAELLERLDNIRDYANAALLPSATGSVMHATGVAITTLANGEEL